MSVEYSVLDSRGQRVRDVGIVLAVKLLGRPGLESSAACYLCLGSGESGGDRLVISPDQRTKLAPRGQLPCYSRVMDARTGAGLAISAILTR